MSATESIPRDGSWFENAKLICLAPPAINHATVEAITEATLRAPANAVLENGSERMHAVDAVAIVEAAHLGASVSSVALLEYLHEFATRAACPEDVLSEIADLLTIARGVRP